ncbi:MAG: hypothetical protein E4H20_03750 [Spirochaetales bacterium]|nr:MAG: hypothetical protein E4H20_03750 [Spirochaetales bacterium]
MRRMLFAALVLVSMVAISCASSPPASSPMDAYWASSGTAFPASTHFVRPITWKAGQYIVIGSTVKGKRESVSKTLLVRKDKDGWVLEMSTVDRKGNETVSQVCFSGYEEAIVTGTYSQLRMVWMKNRDEKGEIQVISGDEMTFYNTFARSAYENMIVKIDKFIDGGTIAVPAGSFSGTNYIKASVKVMGFNIETETWYHPAVPLTGVVLSRSTDGKSVSELLSYGFDGKPILP